MPDHNSAALRDDDVLATPAPAVDPVLAEVEQIPRPWEAAGDQQAGSADDERLPTIVLVAAGLAVVNAVLTLAMLACWAISPETVVGVVRSLGAFCLLLCVAALGVAGMIQAQNNKLHEEMPGSIWATWAVVAGLLLLAVTLFVPIATAFSQIAGGLSGA